VNTAQFIRKTLVEQIAEGSIGERHNCAEYKSGKYGHQNCLWKDEPRLKSAETRNAIRDRAPKTSQIAGKQVRYPTHVADNQLFHGPQKCTIDGIQDLAL
jgi:hypothetical protein